jgi:glycosyltransferase involved in cell wall biosynthesis
MAVLHISNDFSGSRVYSNLISKIDDLGLEQVVYTAVRSERLIGRNALELHTPNSRLIYSNILSKRDSFFFHNKIKKLVTDLDSKISVHRFSAVHAHTWFSDGAVAYELFLKYRRPFIITVRNTDLNLFWKFGYHLRRYALKILKAASSIVFISPSYKDRFEAIQFPKNYGSTLLKKCVIVPSGIDDFWFKHLAAEKALNAGEMYSFLYVGRFTKGKNLFKLIESIIRLNKKGVQCTLSLVGNDEGAERKLKDFGDKYDFINFLGEISSKEELLKIYRSHNAFAMPSLHETLGLVYMEAISQGLPVLYSINEGIDGLFDHSVGVAVNPHRIESIIDGLKQIISSEHSFQFKPKDVLLKHNWQYIAGIYCNIYRSTISTVDSDL